MTKLVITGGAGFLGNAVGEAALAAGFEVHLTWRNRRPQLEAHHHRVDLADFQATRALLDAVRPDVVIHAAGGPHRPVKAGERLAGWRDTVTATVNLLEACRRVAPRLVHIASGHEYAPSDLPHTEAAPLRPVSARGAMKLAALGAVRQWALETGHPTVVVRPFSVYGPGQQPDQLVPTALRCAVEGRPLATPKTATRRDLVFVGDVARGILAATTSADAAGEEFNLGTGADTSVSELVAVVEDVTGRPLQIRAGEFPLLPGDRSRWAADPTKARRILGWEPEVDLRQGLALTLASLT